jgi:hypothetical protein
MIHLSKTRLMNLIQDYMIGAPMTHHNSFILEAAAKDLRTIAAALEEKSKENSKE